MSDVNPAYGKHLNRVRELAVPCPRGHTSESLDIYENVAVWACGWVRNLPSARQDRWAAARQRRKETRPR